MAVYETDRRWSDRYIDAIRAIIGPRLLVTAPWELDRKQNTDLMVLTARDMTIACRVRRPGYASRYGWDVHRPAVALETDDLLITNTQTARVHPCRLLGKCRLSPGSPMAGR